MKLLRYETSTSGTSRGQEKPGLLDEAGVLRDLSGIVDDLPVKRYFLKTLNVCETLTPRPFRKLKEHHVLDHA